jgi:hypothetical protein
VHFVVSWDISAQGQRRTTIDEALKKALGTHSWVRPLTTFYVVQVYGTPAYDQVIDSLTRVAQAYPSDVHLVITPLMSGGVYNGFLPSNLWPEIQKRSM